MDVDFLSPKATMRSDQHGWGSFATQPIGVGETVAAIGGRCVTRAAIDRLPTDLQVRSIQIDDDLFLVVAPDTEVVEDGKPGRWISHSCAPNCGIAGGVLVVAMRDIDAGEAVSFDHAMCLGSTVNEFECACGVAACRHKVTGHDWMLPELQVAYRGYFSPYLAKRIARLVSTGAERRAFAL